MVVNAAFNFMMIGVTDYNAQLPAAQNKTFTDLMTSQAELDANIKNISQSVEDISVETGALQTFWNSFKGLGYILKLPITLVDVALDTVGALILGTEVAPVWFKTLAVMLITILIILAIIAAMTGGNSNI